MEHQPCAVKDCTGTAAATVTLTIHDQQLPDFEVCDRHAQVMDDADRGYLVEDGSSSIHIEVTKGPQEEPDGH